jgi:hypothetical protein
MMISLIVRGINPSLVTTTTMDQLPRPMNNGDRRNAYKNTLRQRQQSIRSKRASSSAPSDTQSRRSGHTGYNSHYYQPELDRRDYQPGPSNPEHGISLRSLREEASIQQQRHLQHYNNQHQYPLQPSGQHSLQRQPSSSSSQFHDPMSTGSIVHAHRRSAIEEVPITEFRTRRWEDSHSGFGMDPQNQQDPATREAFDLRELLLTQRPTPSPSRQSRDKTGGMGLTTKVYIISQSCSTRRKAIATV